jgi:hypothetical protein
VSPHDGDEVTNVPGIVTAIRSTGSSRGYWIQDPDPDSDPATSEGIFAFTSSPGVAVGDSVLVSGGGNIRSTKITPDRSALDFWESREGMRVQVDDAGVVGPSNNFGEQFITTKPTQATTYRGGTEILAENAIPSGRVEVVPADGTNPGVDVGDVFSGATVGPVDYSQFGGYLIAATTLGSAQHNHLAP